VKQLIVIGGPTASGKTQMAIELAQHLDTEIISADSRQFYAEMRIGNARPSDEELAAVPHHFVADRSIHQPLSAGRFAEEALARLDHIYKDRDVAVAAGGSGLYLKALCEGLDEFPEVSAQANEQVDALEAEGGLPALQQTLRKLDPEYYQRVDRQNIRRLQRALRVCFTEGRAYSSYLGRQTDRPFQCHYFTTSVDRAQLYRRIECRVDDMLIQGLEEEARGLYPHQRLPALQTVGYREWWPCFAGEYDRDRAIELIKRNSRRYAKRQITWFKNYTPVPTAEAINVKYRDFTT
jgi:tRNA dimethylallyltransferase